MTLMGHERGCAGDAFVAALGSVTGAEHLRLGRNNQDGHAAGGTADGLAVVVTDGCSQGRYSEVGARLAAEWLAAWAPVEWRVAEERPAPFAEALAHGLEGLIRRTASRFGLLSMEAVIADYFLFTFLVAVVGRTRAAIVGMGDGVFAVDDEVTTLDSGPENAPRYIAYRAAGTCRASPSVHFEGAVTTIDALAVASDGAIELPAEDDLGSFLRGPRYRRNKSLLGKRLSVIARGGRLTDDTTIAALLRRGGDR